MSDKNNTDKWIEFIKWVLEDPFITLALIGIILTFGCCVSDILRAIKG